ncbi:ABC transporter substrate-binding protein [Ktedonobacter racemifer]|uniref:Extracellular solute-binding protein family 1 n=1 Tax=Ktedonobacter racemifer DSM 44963 TaxID=485913 RepID=D6U2B6_KTERA|nr:sugar ABC transporter substrate-binding protein [Ktedonobacter racemifer]EFH82784.1 extracellular solute-binding protein family 1 [Ktedonobacter racemifer DSM 44963]
MSHMRVRADVSRRQFLQYSGSMMLGGSLLAACAGTGGSGSSGGSSDLPALTQWYHQYGEPGTHDAVLKYAKQYDKAKVSVSWLPGTGNEYPDKVRSALLGSNPPDVFENSSLSLDQVKAGLLAPLDDIIADVKSDFKPASLAPFTVNGKVYGIKMINDPTFVYYRKSMFQQAGLDIPKTIDDLIAAAKKLTTSDRKGIYVGPDGGVNALYLIAGWASGGDYLSSDNKIAFNTDRMAAAYQKLHELSTSGGILPDAPTFWWDSSTFQQGQVAMQWCGLWAMPLIKKSAVGDDFGVFPFPALDAQSQPATINGGWAQMVSAKSKNLDAAKAYVKWLWVTNSTIQKDWNVGYGFHVPPRISTSAQTDKLTQGQAADAVDILNKYGHAVSPLWNAAMDTALQNAVSQIVKTGQNAKATLDAAAEKCNSELQKELS